VTAFGLLFGWAGVLYLRSGTGQNPALLYSVLWGVVGMLIVSAIFYFLMRMTETGTRRLSTALGQPATVYMDIPAGGAGQVRVMISGAVSFISARAAGGEALKAGTPVIVKRIIGPNMVEVEKAQP
jgi:membrane protein implicated in regulation of membrane protease activity